MTSQIPLFSTIEPESIVVFDFETTGMSPRDGDRVIEIGAVRLQQGAIVDQFQSLINPECDLNPFIVDLTGINNDMLQTAPPAAGVVRDFCRFVGPSPLVAHNASFDQRFLLTEFQRYQLDVPAPVACSMLAARRVFPESPNHKLGTLVHSLELPVASPFHRALADASMTAALWTRMEQELRDQYGFTEVPFALLHSLGHVARGKARRFLQQQVERQQDKSSC